MDFIIDGQLQMERGFDFTVNAPIKFQQPTTRLRVTLPPAPVAGSKTNTMEILNLWLTTRRAANRSNCYLVSTRAYLRRFTREFPDLSTVTHTQLEDWLFQFKNPNSRRTWLNRISTLFNFAIKREILMAKNPCNKIDKPTFDGSDPITLTVEESEKMLKNCPFHTLPYLALALFAGVRPQEIHRMKWTDLNLETKTVRVQGKTRRRRNVPLEDAAVAILTKCRQTEGNISPGLSTVRRWKRVARNLIGGIWTADILRHTAASMLLAKYQDAGKVATMLGNSPQILLTHYNNPVTAQTAERFWALRP